VSGAALGLLVFETIQGHGSDESEKWMGLWRTKEESSGWCFTMASNDLALLHLLTFTTQCDWDDCKRETKGTFFVAPKL
jgi:hypothetical protein